ncbi:PaaI family thioesterase [Inquilinus sp. CAU 1745]|uniref:PaaI family thioesterase n=1 Tax=Inquilinus sp. CAU 1745 TaxID=3140369 RepID=UPI00325BCEE6
MIDREEFEGVVRDLVPSAGQGIEVLSIGDGAARLKLPYRPDMMRPGGTISGPAQFGLADVTLYGCVLSRLGRVDLAVTTSMTINFLRRPAPAALVAEGRLLKLGKRLAYGEVLLFSEGGEEPVAHATGSYSIPPA